MTRTVTSALPRGTSAILALVTSVFDPTGAAADAPGWNPRTSPQLSALENGGAVPVASGAAAVATPEVSLLVAEDAQIVGCPTGSSWETEDTRSDVLTLAEIATILQGTLDQGAPDTAAEQSVAQRVSGLTHRVKECVRCDPLRIRPSEGTSSTLCIPHLIHECVEMFHPARGQPVTSSPRVSSSRRPCLSLAAQRAKDDRRLERLLCAVARSDHWSGDDWALAARTLDDVTTTVSLLRDTPVIQHAIALCTEAAAGREIADGAC